MHTNKRKLIAGLLVVLLIPAAAFAYWTSTGSGTGSASVDNPGGALALKATIAGALVPGGSAPVSFTATNSGTADVRLDKVRLTNVAVDAGHSACKVADFTMADVNQGATVPKGATNYALPAQGSLAMANTAESQDACKGATLTLTISS